MIQVWLRIAIWVIVIGIGYLLLGPKLFDSSPESPPFGSGTELFLPPAKPPRLLELEAILPSRALTADEVAEYQALVDDRNARFWRREGVSVGEALSGVETGRRAHLASLLAQRGVSEAEAAVFFMVLERDHPDLLADRR